MQRRELKTQPLAVSPFNFHFFRRPTCCACVTTARFCARADVRLARLLLAMPHSSRKRAIFQLLRVARPVPVRAARARAFTVMFESRHKCFEHEELHHDVTNARASRTRARTTAVEPSRHCTGSEEKRREANEITECESLQAESFCAFGGGAAQVLLGLHLDHAADGARRREALVLAIRRRRR